VPSGPTEGGASTSQGRPYGIFKKALQRGNVLAALAAARELPQISLADALDLTILVARKDPRRHTRTAARWLQRYLEEHPEGTIEEAALAASSLVALTGASYQEAAKTLRGMAERATSRRRTRGVA
jgi:hypothetical protein